MKRWFLNNIPFCSLILAMFFLLVTAKIMSTNQLPFQWTWETWFSRPGPLSKDAPVTGAAFWGMLFFLLLTLVLMVNGLLMIISEVVGEVIKYFRKRKDPLNIRD